jgi:curved DNA-binding protein
MDHYEVLQISATADPDTIHRVYRLLAQRFHPDNFETGNAAKFRELCTAYDVLKDPEQRAKYDVQYEQHRQQRWRLVQAGDDSEHDFQSEQMARATVLEVLYTRRRLEPQRPGIFIVDLEALTGRPRESLEFTLWYLINKQFVDRGDNSQLLITAAGVDYLESNYQATLHRRLLREHNTSMPQARAS